MFWPTTELPTCKETSAIIFIAYLLMHGMFDMFWYVMWMSFAWWWHVTLMIYASSVYRRWTYFCWSAVSLVCQMLTVLLVFTVMQLLYDVICSKSCPHSFNFVKWVYLRKLSIQFLLCFFYSSTGHGHLMAFFSTLLLTKLKFWCEVFFWKCVIVWYL